VSLSLSDSSKRTRASEIGNLLFSLLCFEIPAIFFNASAAPGVFPKTSKAGESFAGRGISISISVSSKLPSLSKREV
jgi:hypothetical protein